ncbi:MAG: D-alanyl-D-alanine carboxypeptidase family protein, partial [Hyphomicrobiaceae bacterium]
MQRTITAQARLQQWSGLACLLLAFIWAHVLASPGHAQAKGELSTKVGQAILMDATTGAILFQHNADQLVQPASMSKLMTLALTFKLLKAGKIKLSDEFVMSVHAWRTGGAPSHTAAMMVPVNTKEPLSELIQGIIVQSGNDAAICIAEGIAGSEAKFAQMMTEEARRIGLQKSQFRNPTGLENPQHLMTVRELALLARHIIVTYPEYFPMFAQKEFQYRRHKFRNRNPLLFSDPTVDGMKTGHLNAAGYGLVATAKRGDRRVIAVVHGASSARERQSETERLLEWGFKNVAPVKLYDADET